MDKKHAKMYYGDKASMVPLRDDSDLTDRSGAAGTQSFTRMKNSASGTRFNEEDAVEALSTRLLAVTDNDSDEEDRIIRKSFRLLGQGALGSYSDDDGDDDEEVEDDDEADDQIQKELLPLSKVGSTSGGMKNRRQSIAFRHMFDDVELASEEKRIQAQRHVCSMLTITFTAILLLIAAIVTGVEFIGPPSQPVGPYLLIEKQEGESFFDYYTFYEGADSVGSNGYLQYVNKKYALNNDIIRIQHEIDPFINILHEKNNKKLNHTASNIESNTLAATTNNNDDTSSSISSLDNDHEVPFVYIGSASTPDGPRDSIRLEGNRRFDRGLFIIDVRHMPAGCGVWPAFWLTDEANWPVNGEIDIVEGVNYQNVAKTALHSTKGCSMSDIPLGTMTGGWDTAQGIPDTKTGIPDMTLRYAQNCFVYDPHQWLNQGCVAVNQNEDTLGEPLNRNDGGVFALEWDPINHHIRTWVFTPHINVPDNLMKAIETANNHIDTRIAPDPNLWPIPYGYFAIGQGTDCSADHFRHMRLVLNTAFCGSVSGNRYQLDCPIQAKEFPTCNDWIQSEPDELLEAYWKIRGVYVYQREWRNTWLY